MLQASKNPPQCACINNVALIQVGTILYEAVTEKKEDQKQKRMQVLASRAQEPAVLHRQLLSRASCRSLAIPVVYLQPRSLRIAEGVHGSDCHVIGMTAWVTGPGRPDQTLHTDWKPVSLPDDITADPRVRIPIFITTAHFYLNDMYEALGPTKFVPGTHVKQNRPEPSEELSILCGAGDVVIFRSEVWHRGTANTSNENRYLLQVHYAQRMITQKFPPYLNKFQFEPHVLDGATDRQRRPLGDHQKGAYD